MPILRSPVLAVVATAAASTRLEQSRRLRPTSSKRSRPSGETSICYRTDSEQLRGVNRARRHSREPVPAPPCMARPVPAALVLSQRDQEGEDLTRFCRIRQRLFQAHARRQPGCPVSSCVRYIRPRYPETSYRR